MNTTTLPPSTHNPEMGSKMAWVVVMSIAGGLVFIFLFYSVFRWWERRKDPTYEIAIDSSSDAEEKESTQDDDDTRMTVHKKDNDLV